MRNFTINALSSQGSQRSLDTAGRVLENSELHCSALLTSCSRLLKLTVVPVSRRRREVPVCWSRWPYFLGRSPWARDKRGWTVKNDFSSSSRPMYRGVAGNSCRGHR